MQGSDGDPGSFDGQEQSSKVPVSFRHGGVKGGIFGACNSWCSELQLGSSSASLGSCNTATNPSSFFKVEWRPLPPPTSVTAASGRRQMVILNLLAVMPYRRPFGYSVVCSRLPVPSGFVPGDIEVDCVEPLHRGGEGAGPDCFFGSSSEVLCANCGGCVVISLFLESLSVNCTATNDNE
jgi:hypothetical protein